MDKKNLLKSYISFVSNLVQRKLNKSSEKPPKEKVILNYEVVIIKLIDIEEDLISYFTPVDDDNIALTAPMVIHDIRYEQDMQRLECMPWIQISPFSTIIVPRNNILGISPIEPTQNIDLIKLVKGYKSMVHEEKIKELKEFNSIAKSKFNHSVDVLHLEKSYAKPSFKKPN